MGATRVRITFSKSGPLIYIGNLDLLTIWERAARRADLPIAYTQGFHPQPKLQLAAPLPLGYSSRCEILDMRLQQEVDCEVLPEALQAGLPAGVTVLGAESIDPAAPALQSLLRYAEYEITLGASVDSLDLNQRVAALLAQPEISRERRGRTYDLRPLIDRLEFVEAGGTGGPKLKMRLAAREGATGRPDEVLAALGIAREEARIERTGLVFDEHGSAAQGVGT